MFVNLAIYSQYNIEAWFYLTFGKLDTPGPREVGLGWDFTVSNIFMHTWPLRRNLTFPYWRGTGTSDKGGWSHPAEGNLIFSFAELLWKIQEKGALMSCSFCPQWQHMTKILSAGRFSHLQLVLKWPFRPLSGPNRILPRLKVTITSDNGYWI